MGCIESIVNTRHGCPYVTDARIDPQSVLGYNIIVIAELTTLPMEFLFFRKQEKQHAFSAQPQNNTE